MANPGQGQFRQTSRLARSAIYSQRHHLGPSSLPQGGRHPGQGERLVLYARGWIRQTASLVQAGPGPLGGYRKVTREQAMQRWMTGVPDDKKATLIPAGWFDAWADATWATDSEGAKANPPYIRAP